MKLLIKKVRIVDPASSHHNTIQDVFVDAGIIRSIGADLVLAADRVIEGEHLHLSPGWVDIFANFGDPGFEHKETLDSGSAAAAAGGFTDVFLVPNTKPVIDSKSQVEYLRRNPSQRPTNIYPIGAVSKNTEGKELAEMYDMRESGAVAFSDGTNPVQSAGLLLKALQYVKPFGGVIIQIPDDKTIGAHGLMHEGIASTRLGLPGKPMMAEELLVARDIKLVRYAESGLHFTGITSPRSLDYIRRAKDSGLNVTCSVTPYHLFFVDTDLAGYDTNLKVYPPIRTATERTALREAVIDGTVDCIATHHMPQDYDSKVLEFEYAKNGMIGLETCYAVLKTILPEVSEERWVEMLSTNPRRIFGLPQVKIDEGNEAILTVFDPAWSGKFEAGQLRSRSKNSPFVGQTLQGKVWGVVNKENLIFNQ